MSLIFRDRLIGGNRTSVGDSQDLINELNRSGDLYAIYNVSGKSMLQRELLVNSRETINKNISLKLAENNKFYLLETYLFGQDQEKCQSLFNEFLNTVEIK